jgi:stage II sporulation protein GA (sporulation sigma-E factor processing peptidase)
VKGLIFLRTIYIDEIFVLNGAVNYILLLATKRIIRGKSSQPRLLFSSIIGAIYAVFMFLPHSEFFYSFMGKFLFSLSLVAITYKTKKFKQYIKAVAVFYMVSFAFGGASYAFMSLIGKSALSYLPLKILATSTVITYICIVLLSSYCRRLAYKERCFMPVSITVCGNTALVNGFLDTGNCLYEPISESPVMVVESRSVENILPPQVLSLLDKKYIKDLPPDFGRRIRLIPYCSVGKKRGVIIGFKPDRVTVGDKVVYDVVVGLCSNRLSQDDSYSALVNPQILGGGI